MSASPRFSIPETESLFMADYHSPIHDGALKSLCANIEKNNRIAPGDFERFGVKRGLRNADGTGVMAGLTRVCSVDGYYVADGERVPQDGRMIYRGIDMADIIRGCEAEQRFGFEEVIWLLLMGTLPTETQLDSFSKLLADFRELPDGFIEDMIMKAPSPNIMNKLARCVLALYSYDENPDDLSLENVLRQCIQIIAQLPGIMVYAYQVKRKNSYGQSMYIHQPKHEYGTAQNILRSIRSSKQFTAEEARLLDLCLIMHAEHGGGNNSSFTARVLTSSGTDTFSVIAGAIGSLKGPKHGGANIKVAEMVQDIRESVSDITDEGQVADYLVKALNREAGDRSGLIYGMGHAVYTLSDPRAILLKQKIETFSGCEPYRDEFTLLQLIERLTPYAFATAKGEKRRICANVDLYSGLVYKMLGIPEDLYTPLFTVARVSGWAAHRIEELLSGGRIIRPAYKSVALPHEFLPLRERAELAPGQDFQYIPMEER